MMHRCLVLTLLCVSAGCSVDDGGTADPAGIDVDLETDGPRTTVLRRDAGARDVAAADRPRARDGASADAANDDDPGTAGRDGSVRRDGPSSRRDGSISSTRDASSRDARPAPDVAPPSPDLAPPPPDTTPPAPDDRATRCPADQALALCLRFEDRPIVDDSPRAHSITASAVQLVPGVTGAAASMAVGSVLRVPESQALDVEWFTLEAWVNPRTLPAVGQRAGVIDNEGQYSLFLHWGGGVSCTGGDVSVFAPGLVRTGTWTSISCTLDRRSLTLWRDGVEVESTESDGRARTDNTQGTSIGANNPAGSNLDGLLDNVRIWRTVRTAREICQGARGCNVQSAP